MARHLIGVGTSDETAVASGGGGFDLLPSMRFDLLPEKELQIHLPGVVRGIELARNAYVGSMVMQISLAGYSYGRYMRMEDNPVPFCISPTVNLSGLTVSVTDQNGYTPLFDANTPLSFMFQISYRE